MICHKSKPPSASLFSVSNLDPEPHRIPGANSSRKAPLETAEVPKATAMPWHFWHFDGFPQVFCVKTHQKPQKPGWCPKLNSWLYYVILINGCVFPPYKYMAILDLDPSQYFQASHFLYSMSWGCSHVRMVNLNVNSES